MNKILKMSELSINIRYSGIYKINFPNGKIYIGLSNHFYRRMLEHNTDFRNNLPIEHAIQKYGPISEFEILELINPSNRFKMREQERYWINYYDSTNKEKGYNISRGGDGAKAGCENPQAKLTEDELLDLYDDLKYNLDISMQQLAKNYNLNISSLSRINNGHTYFHENIEYPLRTPKQCKKLISGTKNIHSKITENDLQKIYNLLLNNTNNIPLKEIGEKFNLSQTTIQNINAGKSYINENLTYPLWKPVSGAKKLTNEQVLQIIQMIKNNPEKSFCQIAKELNISSKTISSINCGTIYKQKNINYPIRLNKKAVSTISGTGK